MKKHSFIDKQPANQQRIVGFMENEKPVLAFYSDAYTNPSPEPEGTIVLGRPAGDVVISLCDSHSWCICPDKPEQWNADPNWSWLPIDPRNGSMDIIYHAPNAIIHAIKIYDNGSYPAIAWCDNSDEWHYAILTAITLYKAYCDRKRKEGFLYLFTDRVWGAIDDEWYLGNIMATLENNHFIHDGIYRKPDAYL